MPDPSEFRFSESSLPGELCNKVRQLHDLGAITSDEFKPFRAQVEEHTALRNSLKAGQKVSGVIVGRTESPAFVFLDIGVGERALMEVVWMNDEDKESPVGSRIEAIVRLVNSQNIVLEQSSWSARHGVMRLEAEQRESASTSGVLIRFLTKTVIRLVIWVALVYGFLFFFPDQTWVWWIVFAFIGISAVWAAFLLAAGIVGENSKKQ